MCGWYWTRIEPKSKKFMQLTKDQKIHQVIFRSYYLRDHLRDHLRDPPIVLLLTTHFTPAQGGGGISIVNVVNTRFTYHLFISQMAFTPS